jgi:hypothetical protein
MVHGRKFSINPCLPLVALPALHLFLVAFTILVSVRVPGGAYYRILGIDPLAAVVGMVDEGTIFYAVLLVFGTAWWLFIGSIGWKSRDVDMSRPIAALGALLSLFSAAVGIAMTEGPFHEDVHDGVLSVGAIFQYICVGMLCLGALVVTIYSAMAALRRKRRV